MQIDGSAREIAPGVFCLGPSGRTQSNVYFVMSGPTWALVDAGWESDAPRITRAAGELFGSGARPEAILLTHCHPDHAGSALELARLWECKVYMHPKELPIATGDFAAMVDYAGPLDRWVVLPIMRALGQRRRETILHRSSLGDSACALDDQADVPGLPEWICVPTPGHTPGHVAFFRPGDRVLITGDALVTLRLNSLWGLLMQKQGLSAPPWYTTWNRQAARESIRSLAQLEPAVLAGGHGMPRTDGAVASDLRAFAALAERR